LLVAAASLVPFVAGHEGIEGPALGGRALIAGGVAWLGILAAQSAAEEIFVRGLILRKLASSIGTTAAVIGTGALFGLLHLKNPGATLVAALDIALVGVLFGALVVKTGSLWFTIGLHIAWNWCEGFVLGQPVSGIDLDASLLRRVWADDVTWSGGSFGPEASVVTALLVGAALIVVLRVRGPGERRPREPRSSKVV
jgi:membrane protease YdiL (CAAX protease family)